MVLPNSLLAAVRVPYRQFLSYWKVLYFTGAEVGILPVVIILEWSLFHVVFWISVISVLESEFNSLVTPHFDRSDEEIRN